MKYPVKTSLMIIFTSLLMSAHSYAQLSADSVKSLLCSKSWHLVKLTDVNAGGKNMGGDLLMVETTFKPDGTTETFTRGTPVTGTWKLLPDGVSLETNQLKDPKTGQEKITILEITPKTLRIKITYRGNNIMLFDYN